MLPTDSNWTSFLQGGFIHIQISIVAHATLKGHIGAITMCVKKLEVQYCSDKEVKKNKQTAKERN